MRGTLDRRQLLARTAGGAGIAALAALLDQEHLLAANADPLAPKPMHFKPAATSAIFIFLVGGTSQVDLFDPKPALAKLHGKPIPESFRTGVRLGQTNFSAPIMSSPFRFRHFG